MSKQIKMTLEEMEELVEGEAEAPAAEQKARLKPPVEKSEKKPREVVLEFTAAPPPRMAITQEQWDATPDEIKSELCRAIRELTWGFVKHREAAMRWEELRPWHDLAAASGTTLDAALHRYRTMENALRNPETRDAALSELFSNLGTTAEAVAKRILETWA